MIERDYLSDVQDQLRKLKELADGAIAQIDEEALFRTLDPESNSIAVLVKHVAGNMRSRWTGFMVVDGEKPDRNRDGEFEMYDADSRENLFARWDEAWNTTLTTIGKLKGEDLVRTVKIRDKPYTVIQAIDMALVHYATHVGQIVFLAKHFAGPRWKTLSIPRKR